MRLFGTFKAVEIYLILVAIFLVFSFNQLCEKKDANILEYWKIGMFTDHHQPGYVKSVYPSEATLDAAKTADPSEFNYLNSHPTGQDSPSGYIASKDSSTINPSKSDNPKMDATKVPATIASFNSESESVTDLPSEKHEDSHFKHPSDSDRIPPPTPATVSILIKQKEGLGRPNVGGVILPTDSSPDIPSGDINFDGEAVRGDFIFKRSAENPSNLPSKIYPEKQGDNGFWDTVFSKFGKRIRREVASTSSIIESNIFANQTVFGVYRCEMASSILTHMNPFKTQNIYQQLFAWRFWAVILLFIHLLLVLFHAFINFVRSVPTRQFLNRIFAFIGLVIWNLILIWIIYQYFMWNRKFYHSTSPVFPTFPYQFYAFLVLSVAMNIALIYEFMVNLISFSSYNIDEYECINGMNHHLATTAPSQPPHDPFKACLDEHALHCDSMV